MVTCHELGTPKGWRNNAYVKTAAQILLVFHNPLSDKGGWYIILSLI